MKRRNLAIVSAICILWGAVIAMWVHYWGGDSEVRTAPATAAGSRGGIQRKLPQADQGGVRLTAAPRAGAAEPDAERPQAAAVPIDEAIAPPSDIDRRFEEIIGGTSLPPEKIKRLSDLLARRTDDLNEAEQVAGESGVAEDAPGYRQVLAQATAEDDKAMAALLSEAGNLALDELLEKSGGVFSERQVEALKAWLANSQNHS